MHCPECGFANAEGANYCQKCGAFLGDQTETKQGDTTEVYQVDETGEQSWPGCQAEHLWQQPEIKHHANQLGSTRRCQQPQHLLAHPFA